MIRRAVLTLIAGLSLAACATTSSSQTPEGAFDGWAASIVAADWTTSRGTPIEAFDNARRDLVAGFQDVGFARADMVDFSLRPDVPDPTSADQALEAIGQNAEQATRGCFLYFTSHGSPRGIVFGPNRLMSPDEMARRIDGWCGTRPTVVIVSACFSGVFTERLAAPNRMIMSAARRDRSSFGCSEDATYPYFDGCILESLPTSPNFLALADQAALCVQRREREEGLRPASEPQTVVGVDIAPLLSTTYAFRR
ncbi:MAG: C13 family peptidase [Brevundimonas sp.]|uniref:C13 family peptidase n=1 Tax=Brevundimonas sp. TaxID=1871086 RepID=UPI003002D2F4